MSVTIATRATLSCHNLASTLFRAVGSAALSTLASSSVFTSLQFDARIGKLQQDVRHQVAHDQHESSQHERGHHEVHVFCQDRLECQSAQSRISDHRFG